MMMSVPTDGMRYEDECVYQDGKGMWDGPSKQQQREETIGKGDLACILARRTSQIFSSLPSVDTRPFRHPPRRVSTRRPRRHAFLQVRRV